MVTLTASVTAGATALSVGQVKFCDASATYCTDIHLLGTAQLTSAGTAVFRFHPGIGNHSYKAVFAGTPNGAVSAAASTSSTVNLMVTGTFPTTTTISASGIAGNYSLTAMLSSYINAQALPALTGTVSFLDTTNNNFLLGTATPGTGSQALSFLNISNPATVMEPNVVATADFNGDGIPDLAISNSNSGQTSLTILLGNGDGTFRAAASPTVGLYPDSIVVADFNGDGIPDLALTSVDSNTVTILMGVGDGTFTSTPNLNTVSTPQSVATGDFNGDGIADLAVVNADSVLIFLGNGDGTFNAAPASLPTGMSPITVAVGDFNGDGIADLAVVNSCGNSYPCNNSNGTVMIFLGKGDGTFTQVAATPTVGSGPTGLVVADFNGDGILDLAVANYGAYVTNAVTVLLGNGDGTFKTPAYYNAPGMNFRSLSVGDFNGDGISDLAVVGFWHDTLDYLLGNGDGTFAAAIPISVNLPLGSGYMASADFNGDGLPDLALPNQDVNGTVAILLTQLTETATATATDISPIGTGTHQVEASYSGNSIYSASVSSTTGLTAIPTPTSGITITSFLPSAPNSAGIIHCNGDSLTVAEEGISYFAGGYCTQMSLDLGLQVYNDAVAGSSTQIGVRNGGVPTYATVSGGVIPACATSGSCTGVTVTFPVGYEPITPNGPTINCGALSICEPGTIEGVVGVLTISGSTITFTPNLAGSAVSAPGAPQFYPTIVYPYAYQSIWAGTNNYTNTAQILSDDEAMVAKSANLGVPSIVLSVIPTNVDYEWYGGYYGHSFPDINNALAAQFGAGYADVLGALINYACASPNITDQSDCTHHEPPTSLRAVQATCTTTGAIGADDTSVPITCSAVEYYGFFIDSITTFEPTTANADNAQILGITGTGPTYTLTLARGYGGNQTAHASGVAVSISDMIHFGPLAWPVIAPVAEAAFRAVAINVAPVTVSATVTGTSLEPTGTVAFYLDGSSTAAASGTVNSSGVATGLLTGLSVGSHSVTATYTSSNGYPTATTSVSSSYTVNKASATITLGSLAQTYTGAPLSASATTIPSGMTVNFIYTGTGGWIYGPSSTAPTAAGSYTVVATISNTNYTGTATGTLVITPATATITLGSLAQTYTGVPLAATATTNPPGLSVILTYNAGGNLNYAAPTAAGSYTVTGTINSAAGGLNLDYTGTATGTLVITPATATIHVTPYTLTYDGNAHTATGTAIGIGGVNLAADLTLSGTTHTNAGTYTADSWSFTDPTGNYASASGTITDTINKAASAVLLTTSLNPILLQNPVTYTATVSSSISNPTGTVAFSDGGTVITACASAAVTTSNGQAICAVTYTVTGTHNITALYNGDTNFLVAGPSNTVSEAAIDINLGTPTASETILPGGTATYSFPIAPSSGTTFPSPVTFTVSSSPALPSGTTMTLTPPAWVFASNNPWSWTLPANTALTGNTVLTVQVPQTTASTQPAGGNLASLLAPFSLALLLLPFAGRLRKSGTRLGRMLAVVLLAGAGAATLAGLSGCGSNTGSSAQTQQSYTVTVTGASGALSHTSTVTLTVE
jgi:hypothetical protein